ncbi:hypothetical protein [Brassicibacter mesophilus]|uniref:hypothetical protein n=1 Tax=Brassicibacter mesophilus TaxID=745119 RepID=UPI003D236271
MKKKKLKLNIIILSSALLLCLMMLSYAGHKIILLNTETNIGKIISNNRYKSLKEKEGVSNLIIIISNQSFSNRNVEIEVAIDGKKIIDNSFKVEDQHNWLYFYYNLADGSHTIHALSEDGAEIEEDFDIDINNKKWILIEYWKEENSNSKLTYDIKTRPFMFAKK